MTVITMSRKELTRLRVLIDIADGRLSVADATGLLGVGRRQVYQLLDSFRACGPDGLISRKRGGPSNRSLGAVFRETVLAIVRERYADFGPTLAAEKLLIRMSTRPNSDSALAASASTSAFLPTSARIGTALTPGIPGLTRDGLSLLLIGARVRRQPADHPGQ